MDEANSPTATWEIANFKNVTSYENSDSEELCSCGENKFYLGLHPKGATPFLSNHFIVYLIRAVPRTADVTVLWKMSLINVNGQEYHSKDIETTFTVSHAIDFFPVSGGLFHFDRDFILEPSNGLLPGGKLVIKYQVIELDKSRLPTVDHKFALANGKALEDYQSLLESSKHSDVVFVVGGKQFKLHKAILSARSSVFGAMFDSDLEESKKNRAEITDIEVEVFEQLLRFIYGGKVEAMEQCAEDLLVLSDKYQLESLKPLCEQSLKDNLTVQTVTQVLTLADMHNAAGLKSKCIEFITANAAQVTATEGWKLLAKDLLMELYRDMMMAKCDKK